MRSRHSNKILNGHPHSIIGKTLLLALVFCFVLSGTRSFSTNAASTRFSLGIFNSFINDEPEYVPHSYFGSFIEELGYAFNEAYGNFSSIITTAHLNTTTNPDGFLYFNDFPFYEYLLNYDSSNPSFYVSIGLQRFNDNYYNCIPVFIFSKYRYNSFEFFPSSDSQSYVFDFSPLIFGKNSSYTSGSGGIFNELVTLTGASSITDGYKYNSVVDPYATQYFEEWLDSDYPYLFVSASNSSVGAYSIKTFDYIDIILVNSFDIFSFTTPPLFLKNYTTNLYDYGVLSQYGDIDFSIINLSLVSSYGFESSSQNVTPTPIITFNPFSPTPIPSIEAYPTPTAFPTIAINNNLTPIPEDIDPGIIWEDISTDDVAGNLHGVINTITEFISSAVPRFYSEVLTIMYRRSDWFSFLAIIPGLSLIIFLIGRLRRK